MNLVGPGSPNDMRRLDTALRMGGREMGLSRITNQHDAVLGLSSDLVVFRVKGEGRAEPSPRDYQYRQWTGQEWFDYWWPALSSARREPGRTLIYTFLNEVYRPEHHAFFDTFYRQLMDAADRAHITISVGNFSGAVFNATQARALIPLAKEAARRGHYMSGNVYWWNEDSEARFRYLVPLMEAVPEARWIVEELGWADWDASYQGYMALKALVARYRAVYPSTDAALWCFNGSGGGWQHSNVPVEDALAALSSG